MEDYKLGDPETGTLRKKRTECNVFFFCVPVLRGALNQIAFSRSTSEMASCAKWHERVPSCAILAPIESYSIQFFLFYSNFKGRAKQRGITIQNYTNNKYTITYKFEFLKRETFVCWHFKTLILTIIKILKIKCVLVSTMPPGSQDNLSVQTCQKLGCDLISQNSNFC